MSLVNILLFGIVQGLTEFLPVSSTGHLVILEKIFHLSPDYYGLSFDIFLHLGTLLSLLVYFRKKIVRIITAFFKGEKRLVLMLAVGTVPALFFGYLTQSLISSSFRSLVFIGLNLIFFSFVFLLAERLGKKRKNYNLLTIKDSFVIGLFQSLALLPGVSRSGITISGGLLRELKEGEAGEFAFLLSIPVVILAFCKDLFDLYKEGFQTGFIKASLLGALVSFIVGFFCIKYFLSYLKKKSLLPFIVYRLVLGVLLLFYSLKLFPS